MECRTLLSYRDLCCPCSQLALFKFDLMLNSCQVSSKRQLLSNVVLSGTALIKPRFYQVLSINFEGRWCFFFSLLLRRAGSQKSNRSELKSKLGLEQGVLQADLVLGMLGLFVALLLQHLGVLAILCVKRSPATKEPPNLLSRKLEAGLDKWGCGLCCIRNARVPSLSPCKW